MREVGMRDASGIGDDQPKNTPEFDEYTQINLRQVALEHAVRIQGERAGHTGSIIDQAQAFYDFLKGGA